ncbi:MAG: molybdopterin-dependent oxidoreductase [Alphaproteobacteria bacterium]|nr:molybdopterin-dependent oxidoreductase [Alphaproteobacteria bacterium]
MSDEIRTTCPYCGVGCGVVARGDGTVVGDPSHPSNRGRLCSKGAALADTLDDRTRLLRPRVFGADASWDAALDLVAARFRETIAAHGPDSVAFYVSGQFLTEDYYVANKLMKGFIGSGNIDTNSRLCMASSVAGHVRAFGEDIVPGVYEDWAEADLVVLVGSNAAWCHPVLHQRLLASRAARGTRIVVLDPRRTATAEAADLHLPCAPDADVLLFNGLLAYLAETGAVDRTWTARHASGLEAALDAARADAADLDSVAARSGVDPEALEIFYEWFARTERVVTVYSQGVNQSASGTDKVNAILNCHLATGRIGRPGMGPFSVTGQPNAMGGREVGGLANQLAAHMAFDRPGDIDAVRRFWRAPNVATRPGLKAVELFDAMLSGQVKAVWIAATNPAASMPRAERVRAALAACPFVVVSDCWPTDTTAHADVLLPAAGWGEKDGTVTSSERRISRQRPFRAAPGEARPDWWMFAELGRRLGFSDAFAWNNPAAVFREHAALSGFENKGRRVFDISALAGLDDAAYDALRPVRWPLPAGGTGEGGRLFAAGGFPTEDGRARLVPTPWRGLPDPAGQPLLLNTGRVRDQWHTMTRTGLVRALMAHTPEPRLAIHPADAAALGLAQDDLAEIETTEGTLLLRADLRHAQRRGEAFAPMHWTDAFASTGPVARVVGAALDPHSGQPALKMTPCRVRPITGRFHGLLVRRAAGALPETCHWVRVPIATGALYQLVGLHELPAGEDLVRLADSLLGVPRGADRLELADARRGVLRIAALVDGVLEACLFLARDAAHLPRRDVIIPLLGQSVPDSGRGRLLAGLARGGEGEEGPHVCACFGIARQAVRHAVVTHRLRSVAEIGAHLRAGTNCGSCIPELEEILRDVRVPAA